MYSKKTSGGRSDNSTYSITPPPGYDGSRFRLRSDGRDDAFPPYDGQLIADAPAKAAPDNEADIIKSPGAKILDLFPFLRDGIGKEELIIIALILILAGEKGNGEMLLMLALLLCI